MKRTFRIVEEDQAQQVVWVNGQLPYVARVGDKSHYTDATSPPLLLSAEWTEHEREHYLADYLSRQELIDGFSGNEHFVPSSLPEADGVAPNQPYRAGPFRRQSARWMVVFALVHMFMCTGSLGSGQVVGKIDVTPDQYSSEYLTDPFTITAKDPIIEADVSSQLDHEWLYLDMALVNEAGEVTHAFSEQLEYYYGVEGGESWSEGSRSGSVVLKVEPGTYRMLLKGEGDGRRPVHLEISQGVLLTRYYLMLALFGFGWWLVELMRRRSFESARWGDEDDDDD